LRRGVERRLHGDGDRRHLETNRDFDGYIGWNLEDLRSDADTTTPTLTFGTSNVAFGTVTVNTPATQPVTMTSTARVL